MTERLGENAIEQPKKKRKIPFGKTIGAVGLSVAAAISGCDNGKKVDANIGTGVSQINSEESIKDNLQISKKLSQDTEILEALNTLERVGNQYYKRLYKTAKNDSRFEKEGNSYYITIDPEQNIKIPVNLDNVPSISVEEEKQKIIDFSIELKGISFEDEKKFRLKDIQEQIRKFKQEDLTDNITKLHSDFQLNHKDPNVIKYLIDKTFEQDNDGKYFVLSNNNSYGDEKVYVDDYYNDRREYQSKSEVEKQVSNALYWEQQEYRYKHKKDADYLNQIDITGRFSSNYKTDLYKNLEENNISANTYKRYKDYLKTLNQYLENGEQNEVTEIHSFIKENLSNAYGYFSEDGVDYIKLVHALEGKTLEECKSMILNLKANREYTKNYLDTLTITDKNELKTFINSFLDENQFLSSHDFKEKFDNTEKV